jgi:hypothetical protein
VTARTRSQGASNRYSGRETEQRVARHLRQFWPESKRLVRTGFRNGHSESADEGDLHGIPFAVQIKGHQRGAPQFVPGKALADLWSDANNQAMAHSLPFAVIIEKRLGCADVDDWFAWLPMRLNVALATCATLINMEPGGGSRTAWHRLDPNVQIDQGYRLVRMNVREFLALVKAAGVPMAMPEVQVAVGKNKAG